MHAYGWRMIYAKYDCILIWLRCQIFNKIIKQLKSKVTLENLRGTVLKAKIFDIAAGHFHCMFESVCVWFDLCYKLFIACWNFVGIYNSHKAIYLSGFRQKYLLSFMTFLTNNFNIRLCLLRHVKRMADPHASWTPHQHLYLPSLYSVHILSI